MTVLIAAGIADFLLALLHVAIAAVGAAAYRYFRAGEAFAAAAEAGSRRPVIETVVIAGVFAGFGLFTFSAAGIGPRLPFATVAVGLVGLIFLARGAALLFQLAGRRLFTAGELVEGRDLLFSSASLTIGFLHLAGLRPN